MAGGPLYPFSAYPDSAARAFPYLYVGAGANSHSEMGMGIEASIGSDTIWMLRYQMPFSLPTGTCKLHLMALANAATGVAKVNPKWVSVAAEEDPSSATLNAEGTSTVTWATGDEDVYKELKVTLDADTVTAGEIIAMNLTFETTSWTLAVTSCWQASIIWE